MRRESMPWYFRSGRFLRSSTVTVRKPRPSVLSRRVEYFSQGQGEAVVLLPGAGFGVDYLEPLADALARGGYRAVRINSRAAGRSTGAVDVSYHARAEDVA